VKRISDVNLPLVEVHVTPSQSKNFASPKPAEQRQYVDDLQAVARGRFEQTPGVCCSEKAPFAWLHAGRVGKADNVASAGNLPSLGAVQRDSEDSPKQPRSVCVQPKLCGGKHCVDVLPPQVIELH
jgi:hypothetical protein